MMRPIAAESIGLPPQSQGGGKGTSDLSVRVSSLEGTRFCNWDVLIGSDNSRTFSMRPLCTLSHLHLMETVELHQIRTTSRVGQTCHRGPAWLFYSFRGAVSYVGMEMSLHVSPFTDCLPPELIRVSTYAIKVRGQHNRTMAINLNLSIFIGLADCVQILYLMESILSWARKTSSSCF